MYSVPAGDSVYVTLSGSYVPPFGDSVDVTLNTDHIIDITFSTHPKDNIKKYGAQQVLGSTANVTGPDAPYTCDHSFYFNSGQQIGTTVSGVSSGTEANILLNNLDADNYIWYVEVTTSGLKTRSPDYAFYVRFMCSGICEYEVGPASGINIKAYRRQTGELVGETTTAGTGTFLIDSVYNEQHYVIALNSDEDFNALIYDHVNP